MNPSSLVCAIAVALISQSNADFLAASSVKTHAVPTALLEQTLALELSGAGHTEQIEKIKQELQPLYATLPKNEDGRLEPTVVRYALHRYFAKKWGWHLRGISKDGGAWNETSSNIGADRVPDYMQKFFEKRAHGHGLGMDELAVFVMALTDVISAETVDDAESVHKVMGSPEFATQYEMGQMIEMNMVAKIQGVITDRAMTILDYKLFGQKLSSTYLMWADIKDWANDLFETFKISGISPLNPFLPGIPLNHYVDFMHEITHNYGHFQNLECKTHKRMLMDLEQEGTGRVSLGDFYGGSSKRDWPFSESEQYLNTLGALDSSNPNKPSVIIPNYINSFTNCMFPSDFYSVCCIDECEDLMAHVENAIAEPVGQPAQIAEIVSNLASDTVDAPRNLSTVQVNRLSEIAQHHGGVVPLHGRLFAQWMHHAFPRECAFPHIAGMTTQLSPDDHVEEFGGMSSATASEMEEHIEQAREATLVNEMPWHFEEELVGTHKLPMFAQTRNSSPLRYVFLVAAVVSALLPMVRTSKSVWTKPGGIKGDLKAEKCFV